MFLDLFGVTEGELLDDSNGWPLDKFDHYLAYGLRRLRNGGSRGE